MCSMKNKDKIAGMKPKFFTTHPFEHYWSHLLLQCWDFRPKLSNSCGTVRLFPVPVAAWLDHCLKAFVTPETEGRKKKGNRAMLGKNSLFYNKRRHWMPKLIMKQTPSRSENSTREWSIMGIFISSHFFSACRSSLLKTIY